MSSQSAEKELLHKSFDRAEKNKIAIKYLTKSHIAGSLLIIFFSLFRFNISELSFHLLVKSNEVISSWLVRERPPVFGI